MSDNIILSVVIVTWNTKEQTDECIKSIISLPEYSDKIEIIVVDNNSGDGTDLLLKEKYPFIKFIKNDYNAGYAPACNAGIVKSLGKYVLLLGSDTVLKEGSIADCIDFMENNSNAGAVGCRLLYPDGSLQGNCKKFPTLKNAFFTYLSLDRFNKDYDMAWFNYDRIMKVDQIATTFLMFRNDLLSVLGEFDEQYKIMYNDVDLCKRVRELGYDIVFINTAKVFHHGSLSTKKADYGVRKIMYEDIYRYYRNNFGKKAAALLPVLKLRLLLAAFFR